jgi:hypothetical protein
VNFRLQPLHSLICRIPIVLVLLTPFLWLSPLPQYGQTGGLPLGIDITSRYLREAQVYKCIALQSHIVTARRHSSSGISEQQPKGLNPASALRMNSALPAVYASAMGQRRGVVRVDPCGKGGWQKASVQLYATRTRPVYASDNRTVGEYGSSGTCLYMYIDISTLLLSHDGSKTLAFRRKLELNRVHGALSDIRSYPV